MKNIIILLSLLLLSNCAAQQKITAQKDEQGNLIGIANKASFEDEAYKSWFQTNYANYTLDSTVVTQIKSKIGDFTIKGFMGTWCGDSKRETPRFYKLLDAANFKESKFELITVNRSKKTPDSLEQGFNIIRVPTFIFYKNGKEVGRYVEYPRETLEKDILKIISGEPYKHSYDN